MTPTLAHISDYLIGAELREPDVWRQQDYRIASVMVGQAEEGKRPSYERAFLELFGKDSSEVVGWWRDCRKLLFLAQDANRPTPLLLANRASELLLARDLIEIPDHGWVPEGTLPRLGSVPYVGEYRPSEEPVVPHSAAAGPKPRGVCLECAKPICAGSRIHCHSHYRQNAKRSQRCRKRKAAQGICLNCKLAAFEGSQYCAFHREMRNAYQREWERRMREHPQLRQLSKKAQPFCRIQLAED